MTQEESINIGQLLKQQRILKDFTGTELAECLGLSQGTVSNIENGKFGQRKNSLQTVKRIADFLDLEIELPTEKILYAHPLFCCDFGKFTRGEIRISAVKREDDLHNSDDSAYKLESHWIEKAIKEWLNEQKADLEKYVENYIKNEVQKLFRFYESLEIECEYN
ncbi:MULTISPECIES: helix-turn-helix domain-containing protein [Bacillus]|uniref:helix-turn-helix domain-containing protein n=1 Tax=Bacillus TaxID=1386 RepID=UPI0011A5B36E|nr:helix-turn-helix transcriptional regulator [Bacillus subtilis]MBT2165581.1 helix-turn-helix domain-containing protein [Bacillus subtilis]MDD9765689.1 helix-turn-helix transcriptional regulator [Bacillus subtilis]MDD9768645.1 helix-turn-helix transcriptional regulator [Bacillus subtilis]MDD9772586.1 helix-turn-helix transcriptional regulator [Bacillus subtilis]MDD9776887.1 helix-turn-helix transcriptional regulator [Bacillus subtilis]